MQLVKIMEIPDELQALVKDALENIYKRDLTLAIAEECTGGLIRRNTRCTTFQCNCSKF